MHYWIGSINEPHNYYQNECKYFSIVLDNIHLIKEQLNEIPDKSWMLYLLEIFNKQQIPVELNLISQFDGQNYFEAIFNGYNKYRFTKIIPQDGHRYQREIIFSSTNKSILYNLTDLENNLNEKFLLSVGTSFSFRFQQFFTGIEWWNKKSLSPYPIRYVVEISNMLYGLDDNIYDKDSKLFFPVNSLTSNRDNTCNNYPISFYNQIIRDGCLCYCVKNGQTRDGPNMVLNI